MISRQLDLYYNYYIPAKREILQIYPPDEVKLKELRVKRLKEMKMYRILQEIGFYLLYLAILILVASHNRDSNSYLARQTLINTIAPPEKLKQV